MFRKDLVTLLLEHPMSVPQIARQMGVPAREIEEDLKHLFKSLRNTEYSAAVAPGHCRKCGFEFSRENLRKPSKCPRCFSSWVTEPRIAIRLRDSRSPY
jgi:transcriptional regulator